MQDQRVNPTGSPSPNGDAALTPRQRAEQGLSRDALLRLRNARAGLFMFQLSWILVFVCLIVVNLQMRGNFESWPPPGVSRLGWFLPTVATVALVLSSVLAHRAVGAWVNKDRVRWRSSWQGVLALGAVFIAIMAFEWLTVEMPTDVAAQQYAMIFRVMTGFHALHALVIGVYMWRTLRFADAGVYDRGGDFAIEAGMRLWDFVTIAWGLFFVVLYVL